MQNYDIKKLFGIRLKNLRKKQGLTQVEAAGYLNVGPRFLSDLENGKPTVQLEKAIQVIESIGFKIFIVPKENQALVRHIEDHPE